MTTCTPSTPTRTPSGNLERLLDSPKTPVLPPPSSTGKRKVTPRSEESSAKGIAPLGWPTPAPEAQIDERPVLRLNSPIQGESGQHPLHVKHVVLPFDLRLNPPAYSKMENRKLLESIFPGNHGIGIDGLSLSFYFYDEERPPKPWPKTVAGLPIYFTPPLGPHHAPKPLGRRVNPRNRSIPGNLKDLGTKDWSPLFDAVKTHFDDLGIAITEVIYWGNHVDVVLERRDTDMAKIPPKAANVPCYYFYDDEMGRPTVPQARRIYDPTPGNPDNSPYARLQPGVRVSSDFMPSMPGMFQSTTAGVLVKDEQGNEFMTVASHRFDGPGSKVIHPLPTSGRSIGEIATDLSSTDISLVKLRDGETFLNTTFETCDMPAPLRLKRLARGADYKVGSFVLLDSPDTGSMMGTFWGQSRLRVPVDNPDGPILEWIKTTWLYTGQESASDLPDGMCGSPMFSEEGDVLGFFRYAPKSGVLVDFCMGTAAQELLDRGFTLVDTASRESS